MQTYPHSTRAHPAGGSAGNTHRPLRVTNLIVDACYALRSDSPSSCVPPSLLPAPAPLAMTSRRGSGGQPCKSLQSVTLPQATENTENTLNLARLVPPNAALRLVQRQRSCARRAQGQVRTYPCCIRSIGAARSGAIAPDLYLCVISQELVPPAASLSGLFNIPVLIALLRRASHRIPSPL